MNPHGGIDDSRSGDVPPARAAVWITLAAVLGFCIRAARAWYMPLLGDEVGTWIYIGRDFRYILTHFVDPWLTMAPYIAGTKVVGELAGDHPFVLRLPVVVAGTLAIPFIAGVVLRLGGKWRTACFAVWLAAVNPFLVMYGGTLRSYSFVILFTIAALYFLLAWFEDPRWRTGWAFAAMGAMALLSHFCTLYFLVYLGLVFCWRTFARSGWRGGRPRCGRPVRSLCRRYS